MPKVAESRNVQLIITWCRVLPTWCCLLPKPVQEAGSFFRTRRLRRFLSKLQGESVIVRESAEPTVHPTPSPGTYHYDPKMYLWESQTQSHLFPGQSLECTSVIALCPRVFLYVQPVAALINTSSKSPMHHCFVTQWPKRSLKCVSWFLLHYLTHTDTKFNRSILYAECPKDHMTQQFVLFSLFDTSLLGILISFCFTVLFRGFHDTVFSCFLLTVLLTIIYIMSSMILKLAIWVVIFLNIICSREFIGGCPFFYFYCAYMSKQNHREQGTMYSAKY